MKSHSKTRTQLLIQVACALAVGQHS